MPVERIFTQGYDAGWRHFQTRHEDIAQVLYPDPNKYLPKALQK